MKMNRYKTISAWTLSASVAMMVMFCSANSELEEFEDYILSIVRSEGMDSIPIILSPEICHAAITQTVMTISSSSALKEMHPLYCLSTNTTATAEDWSKKNNELYDSFCKMNDLKLTMLLLCRRLEWLRKNGTDRGKEYLRSTAEIDDMCQCVALYYFALNEKCRFNLAQKFIGSGHCPNHYQKTLYNRYGGKLYTVDGELLAASFMQSFRQAFGAENALKSLQQKRCTTIRQKNPTQRTADPITSMIPDLPPPTFD